jgi:hypothetical protein
MNMETRQGSFCGYRVLHERIHYFSINKANRQGVEAFLTLFSDVLARTNPDELLLLLVDLRPDGMPPFADMFTALRHTFGPHAHSRRYLRVAFMYKSSAIISVMTIFLNALRLDVARRFFKDGQEEAAIAWLTGT